MVWGGCGAATHSKQTGSEPAYLRMSSFNDKVKADKLNGITPSCSWPLLQQCLSLWQRDVLLPKQLKIKAAPLICWASKCLGSL